MNRTDGKAVLLTYRLHRQYPAVFAYSTTRQGGVSSGAYATMNCNAYCGDSLENVRLNRQRLCCELLPCVPKALLIPHQTHGTVVRKVEADFLELSPTQQQMQLEGVDALITNVPRIAINVSTADCIPLFLFDPVHRAIGIVHAGWRGTVGRIVENTLVAMQQHYDTDPTVTEVVIGPGISVDAFEVGQEVYDAFAEAGFPMSQIAIRKTKWHIDLWKANQWLLQQQGVSPERMELCGICTYKLNEQFFSARRQGIDSGRILNGIMLL